MGTRVRFDDDEVAAYLRPPLTTARLPYEQMGRAAMSMILTAATDPAARVEIPVQHRNSVRQL